MHQLGPRALCRSTACNMPRHAPSLQQCSIGTRASQGGKLTLGYISTVNQWMRTFYITGGATAVWFGLKTYRSIKGGCWQPAVGERRTGRRRAGLQCGRFLSQRLTHHAVLGAGVEGRIKIVGWCPMSLYCRGVVLHSGWGCAGRCAPLMVSSDRTPSTALTLCLTTTTHLSSSLQPPARSARGRRRWRSCRRCSDRGSPRRW